jgi:hypothetical protein
MTTVYHECGILSIRQAYFVTSPNGYKALSATCTHLGCEELLQKANTPLIESRASQHTVNLADIEAKAKESLTLSQEVQASAEAALKDLDTRPPGMIVTLAVILVTIVALVPIKLELDRDLERERARQRSGSTAVK